MSLSFDFTDIIDDIKFSENGVFVLLVSYSNNKFWIIDLRKKNKETGNYVCAYAYESGESFSFCGFDNFSQNVLIVGKESVDVFSLKIKKVSNTLLPTGEDDAGLKGADSQPFVGFVENSASDSVLVYSKSRIVEFN